MHVASIGAGPRAILSIHGFPELWYTWRHELLSLSSRGYRCGPPGLRRHRLPCAGGPGDPVVGVLGGP
ncbi:unnamed protein product [Linum tenue]|uniref:Uncharacterized protein n=1 Tax=Linum tenue TaxID=586396 RepID=A0AAV0KGG8_9ROSI|nr:unnamed protein product [Linum tenue]